MNKISKDFLMLGYDILALLVISGMLWLMYYMISWEFAVLFALTYIMVKGIIIKDD